MKNKEWTFEKPTSPGTYWWREDWYDNRREINVYCINKELFFNTGASSLRLKWKGGEWLL